MKELTEAQRKFLLGLTELTRETGVGVGGCGCCGSPFLVKAKFTSSESGYGLTDGLYETVEWLDPTESYSWEKWRDRIVKPTNAETVSAP